MAAATTDTTASTQKDGRKLFQAGLFRSQEDKAPEGAIVPFATAPLTVPTTALDDVGDILRISPLLAAGTVVWGFRGTISDVDTNGSPALVYDVVVINEAGTTLFTLVSSSTKGRTGGTDVMDGALLGRNIGTSGGYIALKVTTAAATAAAGTYKWAGLFSIGCTTPSNFGVYLRDLEA